MNPYRTPEEPIPDPPGPRWGATFLARIHVWFNRVLTGSAPYYIIEKSQRVTDRMMREAQAEADLMLREAQAEFERINRDSQEQIERINRDTRAILERLRE